MYFKKTTGMELDQKSVRRGKARKMILKVRDSIQTVFSKKKNILVEGNSRESRYGWNWTQLLAFWFGSGSEHMEKERTLTYWSVYNTFFKKKRRAEQSTEEKTIKHRWYCVGTEKPQQNTFHRGIRCTTIYANACFLLFTLFISLPWIINIINIQVQCENQWERTGSSTEKIMKTTTTANIIESCPFLTGI